jgi:hypothetical protein
MHLDKTVRRAHFSHLPSHRGVTTVERATGRPFRACVGHGDGGPTNRRQTVVHRLTGDGAQLGDGVGTGP